jgi:hypothetical protein
MLLWYNTTLPGRRIGSYIGRRCQAEVPHFIVMQFLQRAFQREVLSVSSHGQITLTSGMRKLLVVVFHLVRLAKATPWSWHAPLAYSECCPEL